MYNAHLDIATGNAWVLFGGGGWITWRTMTAWADARAVLRAWRGRRREARMGLVRIGHPPSRT